VPSRGEPQTRVRGALPVISFVRAVIDVEKPLFDGDALVALDRRIVALRDARGSAVRFSEAYWDADDTLAWLRMVRDELSRTGRLDPAAIAFLEAPAPMLRPTEDAGLTGVAVMAGQREPNRSPAVAADDDVTESAGAGRGLRHAPTEPVVAA
jgi:hypothetical protein